MLHITEQFTLTEISPSNTTKTTWQRTLSLSLSLSLSPF